MTDHVFRAWAPHASDTVALVLADRQEAMAPAPEGWWEATADVAPDATYAFSIDGGPARFDPRGLRLPGGPSGPSQLFDPSAHLWSDAGWDGVPLAGAVFYELHVGTFTPEGTLTAAAERLGHLSDLGVTMVELMPLSPFPGLHGWGYDGVAPYAVHEPYGGPAALQHFVDAAHAYRLGVCLDVVYNHLGPDGNHLAEFGPYLTDAHLTPWGEALNLDAPASDEVRRWVLDNVVQWFRDFHVDALRLDAVHELHDGRALPLLEEMSGATDALAAQLGRPLWLVAESDRNDPRTVTPRDAGGLGLHGQWADDVHHALHVLLTGEAHGYYTDFADPGAVTKAMRTPFFHDGTWSSFRGRSHGRPVDLALTPPWRYVASLQTHDQVGNRALGDRPDGSPGRLACGAALLLFAPWTPLLFMGQEWGAGTPWQFFTDHTDAEVAEATQRGRKAEFAAHDWSRGDVPDPQDPETFHRSKLDWGEPEKDEHAQLLTWYRDLLRLRREHDIAHAPPPQVDHDNSAGTVVLRWESLCLLVNLGEEPWVWTGDGRVLLGWDGVRDDNHTVTLPRESAAVVRAW
jgi:maltooligosyltrehalose trehalohydrolase